MSKTDPTVETVEASLTTARVSLQSDEMVPIGYNKSFLDFFEETLVQGHIHG